MNQIRMEEILAEYADGLANGSITANDLLQQYQAAGSSELEQLLQLALELESILVQVAPSTEFVAQLRHDLLDSATSLNGYNRWWQLSPLQIGGLAAGIGGITVAAAGILWYVARRASPTPEVEMGIYS